MNNGDVTRKTLEWALERVPRVDGDIVAQMEARRAQEEAKEAERTKIEDERNVLALAWTMEQKARAQAEGRAKEAEIRLDEARRKNEEGAEAAKEAAGAAKEAAGAAVELLNRDNARREKQGQHGRKGGGQSKDNPDAREALRKLLATWAKDPQKSGWTNEALIEEGVKVVNENRKKHGKPGGLECHWESYRPLLPPCRRRKRKPKKN